MTEAIKKQAWIESLLDHKLKTIDDEEQYWETILEARSFGHEDYFREKTKDLLSDCHPWMKRYIKECLAQMDYTEDEI